MTLMDTAQLLGNVGEFIGSIVIVVTLIYLALQIRQNTTALHAQSRQSLLNAGQTELFTGLQNPSIPLSLTKPKLTPEEHVKLYFWFMAVMRVRHFAWLQYRHGVIDESQWRHEEQIIQNVLLAKRNRTWWVSLGRRLFPPDFVNFVDDLIRDQPVTDEIVELITNWTNTARQPVAD